MFSDFSQTGSSEIFSVMWIMRGLNCFSRGWDGVEYWRMS